ncbi:MAG: PAS domain S-box protein [Leptolyngbyaceae bacterium]|nr:PAS domain S-box protein [Leptolyngbyaceae bacterium]
MAAIIRDPITVAPDITVRAVTALMHEAQLRLAPGEIGASCVVVVASGQIVGLLTERDIVGLCATGQALDQVSVAQVMSTEVLTLAASALTHSPSTLPSTVHRLQQQQIQYLPLVDDQDCLVGLVSRETLWQYLYQTGEQRLQPLESQVAQHTADLAEREARYRKLMEGASDAILVATLQGQILEGNALAEQLLGYTQNELRQLHFTQLHPPEELATVQRGFGAEMVETLVLCRDGRTKPVEITSGVFTINGKSLVQGIFRDISQRKTAERALHAENTFRQLILEHLTEGLCVCHPTPDFPFVQFTVWNAQMERITGYTQAEINQRGWYQTLYPDPAVRQRAIARMETMRQGDHIQAEEWTIRHRDGGDRTIAITTTLLQTAPGESHVLAVMQDITDRQQTEQDHQRLLQELTGFKRGLDQATVVTITDTKGVITYANQKFVELSGYSEAELIGQTHRLVNSNTHSPSFFQDLWRTIRQGEIWRGEVCNRAKDGRPYWLDTTIVPFVDADGKPERYLAIRLDITEQKEARLALQESQQFLKTVLDTVPLRVFWKDRELRYLGANAQFLQDAALSSAAELVGKSDFDLPWGDTDAAAYRLDDGSVIRRGEAKLGILETQHQQDGTEIWVETNKLPLRNLAGAIIGVLGTYQDVTERRNADITLRRQLAAIEAAVDGIAILENDRFVYLNSSHVELFGYKSTQELIGQNWQVLYSPEELARFERDIFPTLQERMYWQGEAIATRKDGTTFIQQLSLTISADNLLICVCQDISDRKAMEAALKESRDHLQAMLAALPDLVFRVNRQGQYLDFYPSPSIINLAGPPSRVVGQTLTEVLPPEIAQGHLHRLTQVLRERTVHIGEQQFLVGDELCYEEVRAAPCGESEVVFIVRDISDRKQTELALSSSESRFRRVFESDSVGMIFTDFSGKVTDANDRFLDIIGYSRADLDANRINWAQITPPEYVATDQQAIAHLQRYGEIQPFEKEYQRPDGSRVAVLIGVAMLPEGEDRCVCVIVDISDRKAAEAKLLHTNAELARATRLKDEFLANMSHELRTPLNAILGMTESLQESAYGSINQKQRDALQTVESSATHLLSLINDILDVAKIESGQVALEPSDVVVEQLCASSLTFVKQLALKKNIQLKTKIPPRLPDLWVDEIRMRQVLINLLTNAVKFTPAGGIVTLAVTLTPPALDTSQPPYLRIAIIDTGIGIAPENISRLFQPFVQIDGALNRQHAGTGLGLALVKKIVELHGGQVELTSQLGQGSCFTMALPYEAHGASTLEHGEGAIAPETDFSTPSSSDSPLDRIPLILLAEDNLANIATLSGYLKVKGYQIVCANDGQAAIDMALSHQPDVILMDVQMPDMDGLEAMRQIRQIPSLQATPIIALTALAMKGDRKRCLDAGADEYISKPVRLRQLDTAIKELLTKGSQAEHPVRD